MSDRDYLTLSTGRQVYAFGGVLGLSPDADEAYYGWDGTLVEHDPEPLTPAERQEIAAEMIRRWTAWAERAVAPTPAPVS